MGLMRYPILTWILCCLAIGEGYAQSPTVHLTLDEAKALAIQNQAQALLAQESYRQTLDRQKEAKAGWLPTIDFKSYQVRQTENLQAIGITIPGLPFVIGPFDTFDARVILTQNIFNMAQWYAVDAADYAVKASAFEALSKNQTVATQAALSYIEAERSEKLVQSAQSNVALSESLLQLAQDQKKNGLATGVDVVRAQSVNTQNHLALRQALGHATEADTKLHRALGLPMDAVLVLSPSSWDNLTLPVLLEAINAGLAQRPDLLALGEALHQKAAIQHSVEAQNLPTLGLVGNIGASGVTPSQYDYRTYSYGLQLSVPIFEGGAMQARADEAASQKRSAELTWRDTQQQVEEDIRLAWNDWEIAQDQIKTALVGLSLAEQLMEQTKDQFQNGVADSLAMVSAEANLATARATKINAEASLAWAWINFQMATGQITFNS